MEITKHSEVSAHLSEPEGNLNINVILELLGAVSQFLHYANAVSFSADVCSLLCLLCSSLRTGSDLSPIPNSKLLFSLCKNNYLLLVA